MDSIKYKKARSYKCTPGIVTRSRQKKIDKIKGSQNSWITDRINALNCKIKFINFDVVVEILFDLFRSNIRLKLSILIIDNKY